MYFTFYPVEAFIELLLYGPIGLLAAWFTVFQQAGVISSFVVTILLMPEIQRMAFDAVLSKEYTDDVVLLGKLRRNSEVPFLVRIGKLVYRLPEAFIIPFILLKIVVLFMINSIPIVGPIIIIFIKAPTRGLQAHSRYFTLKGYDRRQIKDIYKRNTGHYTGFGLVANIFEAIPLFSLFFMFTNTIGAALWVIDIESEMNLKELLEEEKTEQAKNEHEELKRRRQLDLAISDKDKKYEGEYDLEKTKLKQTKIDNQWKQAKVLDELQNITVDEDEDEITMDTKSDNILEKSEIENTKEQESKGQDSSGNGNLETESESQNRPILQSKKETQDTFSQSDIDKMANSNNKSSIG